MNSSASTPDSRRRLIRRSSAPPAPDPQPLDKPWWATAVWSGLLAVIALALMTWQVLVSGPFVAWDWSVHEYVDPHVPDGWLLFALDEVSNIGGQRQHTLPVLFAVGLWIAYKWRWFRPLIAICAGLATIFFIGYAIKFGLARTPPADGIDMLHGDGQAFPSGHTANATFTWIILVIVWLGPRGLHPDPVRFRRWLAIAGAWILVTSGLMVLLDYHWISDIPGGWALGALATSVAVAVLNAPPTRVAHPSQREC